MATDIVTATLALLAARKDRTWLSGLPMGAQPKTIAEAYAVQRAVAEHLGPIAGWKVGAPSPTDTPQGAPLHAETIFAEGEVLSATMFNVIGIEGEVGYRLGKDLPPRDEPYSATEVLEAIETMHPMIEIADTRFTHLSATEKLSHFADQSGHGALIIGPGIEHWRHLEPVSLPVKVVLNGHTEVEKVGGNSAGDPIRLIQWLADEGAVPYGGLKAGQMITTGSCTGCPVHNAPVSISVSFEGLGTVTAKVV